MSEIIEDSTGLIESDTRLISENTGLIESDTRLIPETNDDEDTVNKRRKRSKERGKDSKPRNYPLHTMKNLPQFRDNLMRRSDSTY